jgi:hypothetical protein
VTDFYNKLLRRQEERALSCLAPDERTDGRIVVKDMKKIDDKQITILFDDYLKSL